MVVAVPVVDDMEVVRPISAKTKTRKKSFSSMSSSSSSLQQCDQMELSPAPTIPKINKILWKFDPTPTAVSIGPYHSGSPSPQLEEMDRLKPGYVNKFFQRRNPSVTENECQGLLRGYLRRIECCYSAGQIQIFDKLLETVVRDACFIVELLLAKDEYKKKNDRDFTANLPRPQPHPHRWMHPPSFAMRGNINSIASTGEEEDDDRIFGDKLKLSRIQYDMLGIENQVPFFVLESMYKLVVLGVREKQEEEEMEIDSRPTFVQLVIDFFDNMLPLNCRAYWLFAAGMNFFHLLHLFHSYATAVNPAEQVINGGDVSVQLDHYYNSNVWDNSNLIPHASELKQVVGFKFKSKKDKSNLWNVLFHKEKGVMEISPVMLDRNSIFLYRNLIAFEQLFYSKVNNTRVTGYAMLMGCLIHSEDDWELLRKHRIVDSPLQREEACKFFREVSTETCLDYRHLYQKNLGGLSAQVLDYHDSKCLQRRRTMRRFLNDKCCSLPAANVILGVVIFGTAQAVVNYLNYFKHKKLTHEQSAELTR